MLAAIDEITFILLMIAENKFSLAVLEVGCPMALVDISVGVFVNTVESLIIPEGACEGITVEESEIAFNFGIITPSALKDSAFAKVIGTLAILSSLFEVATVDVLICIF